MKIKIRNSKDFYSGLLFLFFGGLALMLSPSYSIGTSARMGPGYFPIILGGILTLLGFIIFARGLLWEGGKPLGELALRPLLLVLAAILGFAFLVDRLGLVIASLVMIVTSCLGGSEFRFREVVLLFLVLAAMVVVVFVYGLKLPFKVWPL